MSIKKFTLTMLSSILLSAFTYGQTPILDFDGIDDYVDLGVNVGNGIRTIEMWFSPNEDIDGTEPNYQTLIAREVNPQNNNEFSIAFQPNTAPNAGCLRFNVALSVNLSYSAISDNNSWNASQWYHVAAVVDPNNGLILFIDGVLQNSSDPGFSNSTATNNSPTYLGVWGNLNNRYFNGSIEDVRISTDALYQSDFTPPCPDVTPVSSTIGLWNLNENTGSFLSDASGNGNDGTIFGAIWDEAFICNDETLCGCNASLKLINVGSASTIGVQLANLFIDTQGEEVMSLCIEVPYYASLVDAACLKCDNENVSAYGTIISASNVTGVSPVLNDPFNIGSSRRICYNFPAPTVLSNQMIQIQMQFPPVLDLSCCNNRVDYCLDIDLRKEDCTSCEYTVCPQGQGNDFNNANNHAQNKLNSDEEIDKSLDSNNLRVELSPNPANSYVDVKIIESDFASGELSLLANDGRILITKTFQNDTIKINTESLKSGTYFIIINAGQRKCTKKLIIN